MLDDTARKVLRILFNSYRQEWSRIDLKRLRHLSGRSKELTDQALRELLKEGFIEHQNGLVRVINGWEQPVKTISRQWID
ncbi:conserved hypothetical protein [Paenibacillus curdlanolyticus YK9]|uniref:Uncharacterized protein n=1 Tax=Paenibacillus curdlanolyticus YK9 TaxID=717606 RepID=E0IBV7_9BACL|nr:hypothetical protein [Paenibacillus curdlanolyticus]EFM10187.1 conserved hypothetical protein [Paenibacillus curdlanolyticus YK9]